VDEVPRVMGGEVMHEHTNGYSGDTIAVKTPAPAVVRMPQAVAESFDPFAGLDNDDTPSPESNPFADEIPDWMLAEMGGGRNDKMTRRQDDKPPVNGSHIQKNGKHASENGHQSPVVSDQSPVTVRQSSVTSEQSPAPNLQSPIPNPSSSRRTLRITFSRSGQLDRDKYRLREIVDAVRDPKGRDGFVIVMESDGTRHQLAFPNEYCTASDRLINELRTHFRVDVAVE